MATCGLPERAPAYSKAKRAGKERETQATRRVQGRAGKGGTAPRPADVLSGLAQQGAGRPGPAGPSGTQGRAAVTHGLAGSTRHVPCRTRLPCRGNFCSSTMLPASSLRANFNHPLVTVRVNHLTLLQPLTCCPSYCGEPGSLCNRSRVFLPARGHPRIKGANSWAWPPYGGCSYWDHCGHLHHLASSRPRGCIQLHPADSSVLPGVPGPLSTRQDTCPQPAQAPEAEKGLGSKPEGQGFSSNCPACKGLVSQRWCTQKGPGAGL